MKTDLQKVGCGRVDWIELAQYSTHSDVACIGERRGLYSVLVGKPEGKRSLGRPRRKWEDNIKMDLQEVEKPT
jgi:hypothetical protein